MAEQRAPSTPADPVAPETTENTRIEAFSDAVAAIAITLLVIELKVPHLEGSDGHLGEEIVRNWPSYLAFLVSFWSIGLAWMIHHNMFKLIRRFDHSLLVVNTLFLLVVAFVPHPTAVVADYLRTPGANRTAMVLYSTTWFLVAVTIGLLWWTARRHDLLVHRLDRQLIERITRRYLLGMPLYFLALLLSFVSFEATLVVYVMVGIYYTWPGPDSRLASHWGLQAGAAAAPPGTATSEHDAAPISSGQPGPLPTGEAPSA